MKYLGLFIAFLFVTSFCQKTTQSTIESSTSCKECSCPSWRSDFGDPELCLNIRQPTKELCGHTLAEHRKKEE